MKLQSKPLGTESTLLVLEGEFDANDKPQVTAAIGEAVAGGSKWLLFDMSAVQFVDSVAVGTLIGAAKQVTPGGGDVAVIGAPSPVLRVFEISGTRELLNVVPTLEEARARLGLPADGEAN